MGLLLEKRLCLSCHLDLELIVVLDDARQRGKALELEPEESPIRLCFARYLYICLCFIHNMTSHDSKEEAVAVYISSCITDKVVSN